MPIFFIANPGILPRSFICAFNDSSLSIAIENSTPFDRNVSHVIFQLYFLMNKLVIEYFASTESRAEHSFAKRVFGKNSLNLIFHFAK